jgi:enamine deaminase RidA (YjgF/YER057c/UK114 family)
MPGLAPGIHVLTLFDEARTWMAGSSLAMTEPKKAARMTSDKTPTITRVNPPELGTPPGYSQIVDVATNRIIFIAGQTALDRDGNVVGRGDFTAQATQVFHNLAIALQARGCTAANLVKLTVFLTDMDHLGAYREARNHFFASVTPAAAPAVTLVEVSKLYGADFLIEIEAIAAV